MPSFTFISSSTYIISELKKSKIKNTRKKNKKEKYTTSLTLINNFGDSRHTPNKTYLNIHEELLLSLQQQYELHSDIQRH